SMVHQIQCSNIVGFVELVSSGEPGSKIRAFLFFFLFFTVSDIGCSMNKFDRLERQSKCRRKRDVLMKTLAVDSNKDIYIRKKSIVRLKLFNVFVLGLGHG